jgi:cytochrome b561
MERPQSAQRILAWLILLGAVVQFFLAGLGVFRAEPHGTDKLFESSTFEPHRVLGDALVAMSFALLVLAIVNRERFRLAIVLFVLMLVQYGLAQAGDTAAALAALHPVNGLLVLLFAHLLTRRGKRRERRERRERAERRPAEEPAPAD